MHRGGEREVEGVASAASRGAEAVRGSKDYLATVGLFDRIDGELVREMVLRLRGAHGPSGMDAEMLKGFCRGAGWSLTACVKALRL